MQLKCVVTKVGLNALYSDDNCNISENAVSFGAGGYSQFLMLDYFGNI